jgi:hypothetical protein
MFGYRKRSFRADRSSIPEGIRPTCRVACQNRTLHFYSRFRNLCVAADLLENPVTPRTTFPISSPAPRRYDRATRSHRLGRYTDALAVHRCPLFLDIVRRDDDQRHDDLGPALRHARPDLRYQHRHGRWSHDASFAHPDAHPCRQSARRCLAHRHPHDQQSHMEDGVRRNQPDRVLTTPEGRTQTSTTDERGRLSSAAQPGIATASFGYNSFGVVGSVTQGNRTSSFGYDNRRQLTS